MRIQIANKWRPFSHECGCLCVIPSSQLLCQVFPSLLRIIDISKKKQVILEEISLDIKGPVSEFTVLQDLEKLHIDIWGHGICGYFRYRIQKGAHDTSFSLVVVKAPQQSLLWEVAKKFPVFSDKKEICFENLSFGNSKMQLWPEIEKRNNPEEIFPLIYRLGQSFAPTSHYSIANEGTGHILHEIKHYIVEKNPLRVSESFQTFLLAGFEGMLVPVLEDKKHQGLHLPPYSSETAPLTLLIEAMSLIKKMLIDVVDEIIYILPCLIPSLHCGRMLNCSLQNFGFIDFEWSKKLIRRMIFKPKVDCSLRFVFHKGIHSFRLRNSCKDKGCRVHSEEKIDFISGKEYFFDNFS